MMVMTLLSDIMAIKQRKAQKSQIKKRVNAKYLAYHENARLLRDRG